MIKDRYLTIQGYECLNSCISNYMNYDASKITGSDIMFLGKGYDVVYSGGIYKPRLYSDIYTANYRFMDRYKIRYSREHLSLSDDSEIEEFLRSYVNASKKIMIRVATEKLSYNKVFDNDSNTPHFVNVIGYDEGTHEFLLSDGCGPTYTPSIYEGWLPATEVLEAWLSMDYEYIVIESNLADAYVQKDVIDKAVADGIRNYLNGKKVLLKDRYTGKAAIRRLISELVEAFEYIEDKKNYTNNLNIQIKCNGFLLGKKYLVQQLLKDELMAETCNEYNTIIDGWSTACLVLLKAGITGKHEHCERFANKAYELCDREEKLLNRLV